MSPTYGAIAMAVAVTALTGWAQGAPRAPSAEVASATSASVAEVPSADPTVAEVVPAPAPVLAAPAETATPLVLRAPAKPLALAQEPPRSSAAWKIAAFVVVLAAAALWLRRKVLPKATGDARLSIVRRAAIGFRSELLVVDVEGQRLLLGVTPHSIQSLATLEGETEDGEAAGPAAALSDRFGALLDAAAGSGREAPSHAGKPQPERTTLPADDGDGVAGQARGLLALRGRR